MSKHSIGGVGVALLITGTAAGQVTSRVSVGLGGAIASGFAEKLIAELDDHHLWERYRL